MNPLSFSSVMLGVLAMACGAPPRLMADCSSAADSASGPRVPVPLAIRTVAGNEPFVLGAAERSRDGVEYKVSKFRFYLSSATLIDTHDATVAASLAGRDGKSLPYGVALVDYLKNLVLISGAIVVAATIQGAGSLPSVAGRAVHRLQGSLNGRHAAPPA